jgi:hypothetical protein
MSPERQDHLMRQIRDVATVLARAVGLRIDGSVEEAGEELGRAYSLACGSEGQSALFRSLDPSGVAQLMPSAEGLIAYAELVREEANQCRDTGCRADLMARAVGLAVEALRLDPENEGALRLLGEMSGELGKGRLSATERELMERVEHIRPGDDRLRQEDDAQRT